MKKIDEKTKIKLSRHAKEDHDARWMYIATKIGFGEIVDEFLIEDDPMHGPHYECITSTGVLLVKSIDKKTLITGYIARENQIVRLYGGRNKVPVRLLNLARNNERKKIMEQAETWNGKKTKKRR